MFIRYGIILSAGVFGSLMLPTGSNAQMIVLDQTRIISATARVANLGPPQTETNSAQAPDASPFHESVYSELTFEGESGGVPYTAWGTARVTMESELVPALLAADVDFDFTTGDTFAGSQVQEGTSRFEVLFRIDDLPHDFRLSRFISHVSGVYDEILELVHADGEVIVDGADNNVRSDGVPVDGVLEPGEYILRHNIDGTGIPFLDSHHQYSFVLRFEATPIPEPAAMGIAAGVLLLLGCGRGCRCRR